MEISGADRSGDISILLEDVVCKFGILIMGDMMKDMLNLNMPAGRLPLLSVGQAQAPTRLQADGARTQIVLPAANDRFSVRSRDKARTCALSVCWIGVVEDGSHTPHYACQPGNMNPHTTCQSKASHSQLEILPIHKHCHCIPSEFRRGWALEQKQSYGGTKTHWQGEASALPPGQ